MQANIISALDRMHVPYVAVNDRILIEGKVFRTLGEHLQQRVLMLHDLGHVSIEFPTNFDLVKPYVEGLTYYVLSVKYTKNINDVERYVYRISAGENQEVMELEVTIECNPKEQTIGTFCKQIH